MKERYELTTADGRLRVHKLDLGWPRARCVVVRDADSTLLTRLDFPAEQDVLEIGNLPPNRDCVVHVQHANPLKRLVGKPVVLRGTPRARPLRALISGSGRCGTVSVSRYLDGLRFRDGRPCAARHESLWEHVLPAIVAGDDEAVGAYLHGFVHDIEAAPHFALVPARLEADVVVHLIRDGRRVVQSGLIKGWYTRDSIWNDIKPDLPGDVFEKSCRFWDLTNRNVAAAADLTVRLEDLISSPAALAELVEAVGLEPTDRLFPAANSGRKASTIDHWSQREHAVFAEICGETMDRFYPGWRD